MVVGAPLIILDSLFRGADQLESDQLDLLWHVAIHCFLQVFEIRINRIYVVVIKVRHKYGKPFDNLF